MKLVFKTVFVFAVLSLIHSVSLKAQVVENNSSVPLNFTVVIGAGGNINCTSEGTYQFTLAPHSSRVWRDGVIENSIVSDGSSGFVIEPGQHAVAPLYGGLKDIECTTLKKTVWDHETF